MTRRGLLAVLFAGCVVYEQPAPETRCGRERSGGLADLDALWVGEAPPQLYRRWAGPFVLRPTSGEWLGEGLEVQMSLEIEAEAAVTLKRYNDCPLPTYTVDDLRPADGYATLDVLGHVTIGTPDGQLEERSPARFTFTPHTLAFVVVDAVDALMGTKNLGTQSPMSIEYDASFQRLVLWYEHPTAARIWLDARKDDVEGLP